MKKWLQRLVSRLFWQDALERAFASFVQAIAATGVVLTAFSGFDQWVALAAVGGAAAVGSIILAIAGVPGWGAGMPWWEAVVWRFVRTYLVTFAALMMVAGTSLLTFDYGASALTALIAALVSVGKNYLTFPLEVGVLKPTVDVADVVGYVSDVTGDPMVRVSLTDGREGHFVGK